MRVLLIGFGSRGDVQPVVALGKGLQQAGYEVTIGAGLNFQSWVESMGLDFEPFHINMEVYTQSDIGKEWIEGSSRNPYREMQNMKLLAESVAEQVTDDLLQMTQHTDVLISSLLTIDPIAALSKVQNKRHIIGLLSPLAPTRSGSAGMQAILPRSESILNRWWGYFIESMLFTMMKGPANSLRSRIKLSPATRAEYLRTVNHTPTLLGVSPLVTPPPADWDKHIYVTGYWFLNGSTDWQPSSALQAFLAGGEAPVYIGFGSMSNRDPQGTTQLMIDSLQKTGQRGIIHSGWAGLHADNLPSTMFLLDYAPHDWLFPQMKAIVHHGGAGTTAAALRAGIPNTIVAHIGDQPYWGRRVYELGAGAPPLRRHELTVHRLTTLIQKMVSDPIMQKRAAELGQCIRSENGVLNAVQSVNQILGTF